MPLLFTLKSLSNKEQSFFTLQALKQICKEMCKNDCVTSLDTWIYCAAGAVFSLELYRRSCLHYVSVFPSSANEGDK